MGLQWGLTGLLAAAITAIWYAVFYFTVPSE